MPTQDDKPSQEDDARETLRKEFEQRLERAERDARDARDRSTRAEARLEETRTKPPEQPAPKEYTRAELQKLVDTGSMAESRMQEVLDEQRERRIIRQVDERFQRSQSLQQRVSSIEQELVAYQRARPDAWQEGSESRKRVQDEFDYLVRINGKPPDAVAQKTYEVMALRAAFGSPQQETTRDRRETHSETGGDSGDAGRSGGDKKEGVPKELKDRPKLQYHYEQMIARGHYSGWTDAKLRKELEYVK